MIQWVYRLLLTYEAAGDRLNNKNNLNTADVFFHLVLKMKKFISGEL